MIKESEFKGHQMLNIYNDDGDEKPTISFGVRKAKLIIQHFKDIEEWTKKQG